MIDFILQCYEEYKIFMDLEPDILPQIMPVEESYQEETNGKNPWAYINEDEIGHSSINLYYNSKLSQNRRDFIKAILYHEFTHIYDGILYKDKYNEDIFSGIMHTYSEYHAAQIELACKVGFRNIHSFRKINLDKTYVPYENITHKIEKDYLHPFADALVFIDKPKDYYYDLPCDEYYSNYKTFESKTMYYLGKRTFCSKYSLKRIPNITQQQYKEFYPFVKQIEQYIVLKEFDKLPDITIQLRNKFFEEFPLKESEFLILLNALSK